MTTYSKIQMKAISFCFLDGTGETNKQPKPHLFFLWEECGIRRTALCVCFPTRRCRRARFRVRRLRTRPMLCPTAHTQPANSLGIWLALPAGRKRNCSQTLPSQSRRCRHHRSPKL